MRSAAVRAGKKSTMSAALRDKIILYNQLISIMQQDKQTTFGNIHDYVKRVNREPKDLDFKAQMKECRALMAQKNETQASEGPTSDTTPRKPKRAGKRTTPKASVPKSVSTKPEVAKPIASKLAEQSEPKENVPFFLVNETEKCSAPKSSITKEAPSSSLRCQPPSTTLDDLWQAAAISKAKKPKEKQVWIDADLCHQLELLNLKHGKPSSVKHIINGIVKMYFDEHNSVIK